MSFKEAVSHVFSNYGNFGGRASRSEFWYFYLFNFLVVNVSRGGFELSPMSKSVTMTIIVGIAMIIYGLATIIPGTAVTIRRMHDSGHSGWNLLWLLLPIIGYIWCLILLLKGSDPEENEYGECPE